MSNYVLRKADRGVGRRPVWEIFHEVGGARPVWIGAYPNKKAATTVALVLAGRGGTVTVEK